MELIYVGVLAGVLFFVAFGIFSLMVGGGDGNRVMLSRTGFSQYRASIYEMSIIVGGAIRLTNSPTGVPQQLCVECTTMSNIPKELQAPGIMIDPGQTLRFVFPVAGDYEIVSTTTPGMSLMVHVSVSGA
jgi:hypothetical protein